MESNATIHILKLSLVDQIGRPSTGRRSSSLGALCVAVGSLADSPFRVDLTGQTDGWSRVLRAWGFILVSRHSHCVFIYSVGATTTRPSHPLVQLTLVSSGTLPRGGSCRSLGHLVSLAQYRLVAEQIGVKCWLRWCWLRAWSWVLHWRLS